MGYGEFTRAAARPTAFAGAGAPATQARLAALLEGGTSRQVTRRGRESSLTPMPSFDERDVETERWVGL